MVLYLKRFTLTPCDDSAAPQTFSIFYDCITVDGLKASWHICRGIFGKARSVVGSTVISSSDIYFARNIDE